MASILSADISPLKPEKIYLYDTYEFKTSLRGEQLELIYRQIYLSIFPILQKVRVSDRFLEIYKNAITLFIPAILTIQKILSTISIEPIEYILDIYSLGEEEYTEKRPYIEVSIPIEDTDTLFEIWRTVIHQISIINEQILDLIDIFFTRS